MKNTNKVLCSTDTKFILASVEQEIIALLNDMQLSVSDIKSATTKELEVIKGEKVIAYLSRTVGLSKGLLHVTICPRISVLQDLKVDSMEQVRINKKKNAKSRYISSSNYKAFKSKEFCDLNTSKEHVASGYIIDVNESYQSLKNFVKALIH